MISPHNSHEFTLPHLENSILNKGIDGHPYPAAEYVSRNLGNAEASEISDLKRLERKADLKGAWVKKLILHWICQGLYVRGVKGTRPENNYEQGLVSRDNLREFLSEHGYAIPDCLDPEKPVLPQKNMPENLELLIRAHRRLWGNADLNDKDTHPSKAKVMTWLEQAGMASGKRRDAAATIINPTISAR